ncbi:MAG: cytochrome c [Oceanospirillales bacterium]|nr:cytochrome c [Oceanospirillales bacterium]MBR9889864.1 cytochrome c [Oceanospirillales bacterium]
MSKIIQLKNAATVCGLFLILAVPFGIGNVAAEEELIGADEFRRSCVSCHGIGGKGDGPMAEFLTPKPADLTVIAKNNNGQYPAMRTGQYPFFRVFQIIDGRTLVSGHGDRVMPVWGSRYKEEAGDMYGPMGSEKAIRGRILELVYYIQQIQEE